MTKFDQIRFRKAQEGSTTVLCFDVKSGKHWIIAQHIEPNSNKETVQLWKDFLVKAEMKLSELKSS